MNERAVKELLREMKRHYKTSARSHLPWRTTRDPYRILVSEIMLQQTQVERVVPYYKSFLKQFPTAKALSKAPLSRVLAAWQGLGYNRRAKYLREAARALANKRGPWSAAELEALPGVGHYTARAVSAFAYNRPEVFLETNIRTVLFHHWKSAPAHDRELLPFLEELLRRSRMEPREFYAAMMDYGSFLKRQGIRLNKKSAHYAKQSRFEGSRREKRAAALRSALKRGASDRELRAILEAK